jgi:hypothetical protein
MKAAKTAKVANKRKRDPMCANCLAKNPSHEYKDCTEPCRICKSKEHKTRSCPGYRLANRTKKQALNPSNDDGQNTPTSNTPTNDDDDQNISSTSNTPATNRESANREPANQDHTDIENALTENGVFFLTTMTSAATFPSNHFKSIELTKNKIKFKTINGMEGAIDIHTNDEEVRNVREEFQKINANYVNRKHSNVQSKPTNCIEYSVKFNKKISISSDKIKLVGKYLCQAKYYEDCFPERIPLRKTSISPADWRIEKYVFWERQKNSSSSDIECREESQNEDSQYSSYITGSIFDDPLDANSAVNDWKKGKGDQKTKYYFNPPLVPEDNLELLSDYIEYLSEGIKFIQFTTEINRRSELRYCSYLDKAVEICKEKMPSENISEILKTFYHPAESQDNKDKIYLSKKKMVGKRLNKIMSTCRLNWKVVDCVEELSVNFLTNTVQEENFDTLLTEISKEYRPAFSSANKKRKSDKSGTGESASKKCKSGTSESDESEISANEKGKLRESEISGLLRLSKERLQDIRLKFNQLKSEEQEMGEDEAGNSKLNVENTYDGFDYDIEKDLGQLEKMKDQITQEQYNQVIEILNQRKEYLSQLEEFVIP